MNSEPRRKRSSVPYAAVAVTAGAAFAIVALLHAGGIAYAIVAVVAGLCYTLIAVVSRRND
jgi:Flp pilus assembly protein TadB